MARFRVTVSTSQPDNDPVPAHVREAARQAARAAADYLREDVVYDGDTGVRTAGSRGFGVASPVAPEDLVDAAELTASESASAEEDQSVIDEASE